MLWNARTFTFLCLWTVISAVGGALGLFFGTAVGFPLAYRSNTLGVLVVGVILGAALGIGQWLVLRWYLGQARGWVLASTLGGCVGFYLGQMIAWSSRLPLAVMANFTHGALLGGGLGLAQWVTLRRFTPRAGWWVLASSLGWGAAWSLGVGIFASGGMLRFGLQSLSYGVTTGALLVWLFRDVELIPLAPQTRVRPSWRIGPRAARVAWAGGVGLLAVVILLLVGQAGSVQPVTAPAAVVREVRLQVNRALLEATILAGPDPAARDGTGTKPAAATARVVRYHDNIATIEAIRPTADALHVMLVVETVQPTVAAEATLVARANAAAFGQYQPRATPASRTQRPRRRVGRRFRRKALLLAESTYMPSAA